DVLGDPTDGRPLLAWIVERAMAGLCALQAGVTARALEMTAQYTTTREQFGKPIATFQAVAQRAADAYIDVEAMRWTMWQAAWRGVPAVRPERPSVSVIRPNLLVGEYPNPEDVAWLRDAHGVTTVLSLQDDADLASKNLQLRDLELAYRREGLAFHRVPVPDGATGVLADRLPVIVTRSEERRVGKECRERWVTERSKKKELIDELEE